MVPLSSKPREDRLREGLEAEPLPLLLTRFGGTASERSMLMSPLVEVELPLRAEPFRRSADEDDMFMFECAILYRRH